MNIMNNEAMNDELLDLLTERALGGLSPADEARLSELLETAGLKDHDDMELAVAAAMNAFASAEGASDSVPIPAGLEQKLLADADRFFDREKTTAQGTDGDKVTTIESARSRRAAETEAIHTGPPRTGRLGWAVAAMLALVVVFTLLPDAEPEAFDPTAARIALVEQAGTEVIAWGSSEIPAYNRVTGDVVWNNELQQGYLRLAGMPANDPSIAQYQLWIVDPERDANPVDGGVFDVPQGSDEIIIPIDAKLDVLNPDAFAITREQPGGVVVSDG
ncbi:MAG: anti-sigma factor, partial [Pseudomonadota bacterium]